MKNSTMSFDEFAQDLFAKPEERFYSLAVVLDLVKDMAKHGDADATKLLSLRFRYHKVSKMRRVIGRWVMRVALRILGVEWRKQAW